MANGDVYVNEELWTGALRNKSQLPLAAYRTYILQHELGHAQGLPHVPVPKQRTRAPIMIQQTKGIGKCIPYPFPSSASQSLLSS